MGTSKKPLVGAVSHQTVKGSRFCGVGFLQADWNLQIKKLVHDWAVLFPVMDFSLFLF